MPIKDVKARRDYQNTRNASKKVGKERLVVGHDMLASANRPTKGGVFFLPIDEVIKRQGWNTYRDMLHDDQIKACLAFKRILISGRNWEIAPGDKSEKAKEVAKFVEWNLKKIKFKSVIRESLTALEFGYSLAELVWGKNQYHGSEVICLKKIAHRDPKYLELSVDPHGNLLGVKQESGVMTEEITLKRSKFWIYTHNGRFGDPYGVSDLRSAYRSWWAKKFVINFWNVFLERMGSPMTKMTYPTGASDELKTTLKQILRNLSSKTEILVPEGVGIDLVEATRSGTATYEQALDFHNNSIARAILMVSLLGTGGESNKTRGSDGQSHLQLRILFKMADEISQDVIETFMDQAVRQLVEMNFDGDIDAIMPKFIWQDYGQFEGMKVADTIRLLHAAGILELDQADVNYARSVLGLPIRGESDEDDDVIRPQANPPPGDANAPPPKADQGNQRAKKGATETQEYFKVDFS